MDGSEGHEAAFTASHYRRCPGVPRSVTPFLLPYDLVSELAQAYISSTDIGA
jgi:hypothetical protein